MITPRDYSALEQTIRKYSNVSASSLKLFLDHVQLEQLGKLQHLLHEGGRNEFEYFLTEGVAHRYNITESGEMVTTGFYMPQTTFTPHFARTFNQQNIFSIQALTDAKVIKIKVSDLTTLRLEHQEWRMFGQQVVEKELSRSLASEVAFRSQTAKQRLAMLRNIYPNIENLIPHTVIASYLGVTAVSFSRLRSETG